MSSPSGSGTSRTYSLTGRVIGAGETGTISDTQPGNGYEDSALQDMLSFSAGFLTNNSTAPNGIDAYLCSDYWFLFRHTECHDHFLHSWCDDPVYDRRE